MSIEQIESSTGEVLVSIRLRVVFGGGRTLRDGQCRAPLVPEDIQTDAAVGVDVGVVDAGGEVDLGRLEWVVGREVNGEEEDASRVWRVTLSRG